MDGNQLPATLHDVRIRIPRSRKERIRQCGMNRSNKMSIRKFIIV
jgi:hypothetical protein